MVEFRQDLNQMLTGQQSHRAFRQGLRFEKLATPFGILVVDECQQVTGSGQVDEYPACPCRAANTALRIP